MTCSLHCRLGLSIHPPKDFEETRYLPTFKPTHETLEASYNGLRLFFHVEGIVIRLCVYGIEGHFWVDSEQDSPGCLTWGEILEQLLPEVILQITTAAMNQIECQKQEGRYYEQ